MTSTAGSISKKRLVIPLILAAIIVFSLVGSTTLYYVQSAEIDRLANEEESQLKNQLSEESFYVSQLAGQHLSSVKQITQVLASAKSIQGGEIDGIKMLLDSARVDSYGIVDSFSVFDEQAVLLYTTNPDPTAQSMVGNKFPSHIAYTSTKEKMGSFISPLTLANDNITRVFVASPIIDAQTGEFRGAVSANIRADTFAKSIETIVGSRQGDSSDTLSLIDPDGYIMYAGSSPNNIGKNILSEEVLSGIPASIKEGFVASLEEAVSGTSGIYEINLLDHPELTQNNTSPFDYVLLAYTPVKVDDQIAMISIMIKLASIQTNVGQMEKVTGSYIFAFIYGILGSMTAFAVAILIINKRLSRTVQQGTRQLHENNERLQIAATEIARQADQLREADVKKAEFSAMITHELKTPLVPIIGYGDMILEGKLGELAPRIKQKLQIMHKNAQRLSVLIQDILDVQKLELRELHLSIRQSSARELIDQSIHSLKPQADSKGVRLLNKLQADIMIDCDQSRIVQVVSNLVSNGIKFSNDKDTIEIDAKAEDHSVVFSIQDYGDGIPVDKHGRLFTKFYQVDTSLTRKAGGTGLGLVICKGIVEAHNGKIWFESEPGKGSIFRFSIPVNGKDGQKASPGC
jgi:signal transduction histidine kinase